ncbi:MAG: hypothetical protein IM598_06880 [Chitinophagaceae bacterium]|nr:hypothetical protein [Chitinophagaceae bacterium]MCA6459667.1 hypothetical protein [Chitinophagaceae bacterium]MCA6464534.1 hypothetical protein [Chitinophagaceae bacterium]
MLVHKLIDRVEALQLDLKGKVVLTEAATGAYVVTPLLAALAGAKVYAFTKTTKYGTAQDVIENTRKEMERIHGRNLDIEFITELTPEIIGKVDIITNSGHLRPLDQDKLKHAKASVVIPLMYEAWEWRDADMDLAYVRERGFSVGATNERHPGVDVFNYLGDMAVKLIFDAGICPYNNKFVLICNNDFGPFIAKVLSKITKSLAVIDKAENKYKYDLESIDWISDFPKIEYSEKYYDAEALIFTAYPFDKTWIGDNPAEISIDAIKSAFKDPLILRYAGDVDCKGLDKSEIRYFPKQVSSGHMGILPSAIGFDPIIRLQAGGLKVGECMLKRETSFQNIPIVELI